MAISKEVLEYRIKTEFLVSFTTDDEFKQLIGYFKKNDYSIDDRLDAGSVLNYIYVKTTQKDASRPFVTMCHGLTSIGIKTMSTEKFLEAFDV